MKTKDVLDKMPENVLIQMKRYKEQYHQHDGIDGGQKQFAIRNSIAGYVNGLRDSGFITEQERKILYTYATL